MSEAKHSTSPAPCASGDDFRSVFHEKTDNLCRLASLLTADRLKVQQCFVSGLEDSVNGSPVFKDWAHSWTRQTIIQNAIRAIRPGPNGGTTLFEFRQWWHNAGSRAGRDRRSASNRTVRVLCLCHVGS